MATQKRQTALLLDANALLHRAWHALPPMTSSDGKLVNAVYGFSSVLINILRQERPDYLVACWDTAAPTFRHEAAPNYKAQREKQPQEFYDQIPPIKNVFEAFGGTNLELDGFEADDLLGTLAVRLAREGAEVTLLTSDRDVWQLIGPHIRVMAFKKGVSETVIYDEAALLTATGLKPEQIAAWKALRGDASDNLKGVPGIGEKTATELITTYRDLKGVFAAAHDEKSVLRPAVRKKLLEGEALAMADYPLVQIVTDVPLKIESKDLKRRLADQAKIKQIFTALGFKSLLTRALGPSGNSTQEDEVAEPRKAERVQAGSKYTVTTPQKEKDLQVFLAGARKSGELYVHVHRAAQASLFSEQPELALAYGDAVALIGKGIFEDKKTFSLLKEILEDRGVPKFGHGLKAVWHWLKDRDIELESIGFDTEIASYLLAAGEGGHDLETLAAAHLDRVFKDGEERLASEIQALMELRIKLSKELEEKTLTQVLQKIELPLVSILARMERRGILIDKGYFKQLADELRLEKAKLEKDMIEAAGETFNPASPSQLAHILFDVLKIPVKGIKRGKTGMSTAASELDKLEGVHPIIEKISAFRETAKLLSTYVEVMPALMDKEGRVHTTFNQAVTSTGRLSSTEPNLQNIPIRTELGRKIRRGFIAPRGFDLLSCDYSQIELRIVAALAHDERMLQAFARNADIHISTAAAIWKIPEDEVTKDQRRAAKAINFGIIYGQGPFGLAKSAGISYEEAQHFIEEYFLVYKGIREFLDQTKALARVRGYVETLFGRRRPMNDINSPRPEIRAGAERMAINMPVQGTAADIIKFAMIKVAEELPKISAHSNLLLQVHDELVFEVPEKETSAAAARLVEIMEQTVKIGCPLKVDAKAGKNWEEMKGV
ncbi:MAG: DNA polymerase I [Patescibacteria group bacterium]